MTAFGMARSIDIRFPDSFAGDHATIASRFLVPFLKLMSQIRGPGYQLPRIEHVKLP